MPDPVNTPSNAQLAEAIRHLADALNAENALDCNYVLVVKRVFDDPISGSSSPTAEREEKPLEPVNPYVVLDTLTTILKEAGRVTLHYHDDKGDTFTISDDTPGPVGGSTLAGAIKKLAGFRSLASVKPPATSHDNAAKVGDPSPWPSTLPTLSELLDRIVLSCNAARVYCPPAEQPTNPQVSLVSSPPAPASSFEGDGKVDMGMESVKLQQAIRGTTPAQGAKDIVRAIVDRALANRMFGPQWTAPLTDLARHDVDPVGKWDAAIESAVTTELAALTRKHEEEVKRLKTGIEAVLDDMDRDGWGPITATKPTADYTYPGRWRASLESILIPT